MTLKAQLQQDLKEAIRAQDERRKAALRMLLTAIQLAEVERKGELSEGEVLGVIQKEVRSREDALVMVRQAGRDDLAAVDAVELEIIRGYLPPMLDVGELKALARQAIVELGASSPADMGAVMKHLMPQVQGRADGRTVSQVVRELLAGQG